MPGRLCIASTKINGTIAQSLCIEASQLGDISKHAMASPAHCNHMKLILLNQRQRPLYTFPIENSCSLLTFRAAHPITSHAMGR